MTNNTENAIKPLNTHVNKFNLFYGKEGKINQDFNYLSH